MLQSQKALNNAAALEEERRRMNAKTLLHSMTLSGRFKQINDNKSILSTKSTVPAATSFYSADSGTSHGHQDDNSMSQLLALRDLMSSISNAQGLVQRGTFLKVFDLTNEDYDNEVDMIDGKAVLIDAALELDVFEEARAKHPGEEIGVFFCGSHALDKVLTEMCRKYSSEEGTSFHYHSEKFA
ncbi:TPA: hypothetical protein N0F65_011660 [Lagenidium giganteum]|uniref:Ferric reductase NAD binding domain-containing protein n=1 Tax=Lagenidium giganteum TaxID=4803 RepID=A0AAV2ZAH4_9STRA|nr:TPA: hypothetical protein N0F65_011660 [Lagenidium giganteum]